MAAQVSVRSPNSAKSLRRLDVPDFDSRLQ